MTHTNEHDQDLKELKQALDIYGDFKRMPAPLVTKFEKLVSTHPEAKTLYQQAQTLNWALDQYVLDETHTAATQKTEIHEALQAAIMEKIKAADKKAPLSSAPPPNAANENSPLDLITSGLLAASLLLGLLIGAMGQAPTTFFINTSLTIAQNNEQAGLWNLDEEEQITTLLLADGQAEGSQ